MADTRHWGSHEPRRGPYLMPQLQQTCLQGHCSHQHASCRCHRGYHDNQPHYHQQYSHSHHGSSHYHHQHHHQHHGTNRNNNYHSYYPPHHQTQVIHRHYTEQDTGSPKLLALPPAEPKPGRRASLRAESKSQLDDTMSTQHAASQVELPCPNCKGGWCEVHNTDMIAVFQCVECEVERRRDFDNKQQHHRETQAHLDCPTCEGRSRCSKYDAETQARIECEVCERSNRRVRHDAESQATLSCPDCDRARYCRDDKEIQASFDCVECEGRRGVITRDMATQVENDLEEEEVKVATIANSSEKVVVIQRQAEEEKEDEEKGCQICSALMERLKKSDFLDEGELLGNYVVTKKMSKAKGFKVKVSKKESFRTSTPTRQGPFDTFAEHLGGIKY